MISRERIRSFRQRVEMEVTGNILPFWLDYVIDRKNGGYYGQVTQDRQAVIQAPKGGILGSRILWTFSHAYSILHNPVYLEAARHTYRFLKDFLWDPEEAGIYWLVDYMGKPIDTRKHIYAESFAIYGLAEYYHVTHEEQALEIATGLFQKIEEFAHDAVNKGYLESFDRQWRLIEDSRLSQDEMHNEKKSMNTHLHLMEAYTNLYRVWKDPLLKRRLGECLEIFTEHIIDPQNDHFIMFLDEKWQPKSTTISYGHDIEGSWLLTETAEVLGEPGLLTRIRPIALRMAQAIYNQGLDQNGALLNEAGPDGRLINDAIDWWPQAENVVGMLNAYQLSGQEYFYSTALRAWEFIDSYQIDKTHGEWYERLTPHYQPYPLDLVQFWKCPYHNSRACFEAMQRLDRIEATL